MASAPQYIHEDAAPDSSAHTAVKLDKCGERYTFRLRAPNKQVLEFDVSLEDAGGSREDAARIARLCYDKLAAGQSRDDVEAYRGELSARCGATEAEQARKLESRLRSSLAKITSAETIRAKIEKVRERSTSGKLEHLGLSVERIEKVLKKIETEFGIAAARSSLIDIPRGVKRSSEKLEGSDKGRDVNNGRRRVARHQPAAAQFNETDAIESLVANDGVDDAVIIEGRANNIAHSSINGVYAMRKSLFHGANSYDKLATTNEERRCLFYLQTKNQWVVGAKMSVAANILAFIDADRGCKIPPSQLQVSNQWYVNTCNDATLGNCDFAIDPDVRCRPLKGSTLLRDALLLIDLRKPDKEKQRLADEEEWTRLEKLEEQVKGKPKANVKAKPRAKLKKVWTQGALDPAMMAKYGFGAPSELPSLAPAGNVPGGADLVRETLAKDEQDGESD